MIRLRTRLLPFALFEEAVSGEGVGAGDRAGARLDLLQIGRDKKTSCEFLAHNSVAFGL